MTQSEKQGAPYSLLGELAQMKTTEPPPLHLWHPEHVSDIDIEIKADGSWYHEGAPIKRQRLVRLFSTVMRLESDGHYYLVTPVEKCRIRVEQAPFEAILMSVIDDNESQVLRFTTNVADQVSADLAHPITVEQMADGSLVPFVEVREGLRARLARSVYYQLMALLSIGQVDGEAWYGVWSSGAFFAIQRATEVDGADV
jgi:uncharacterized protein